MWLLALIPAAIVVFLAVLIVRASAFKPKKQPELDTYEVKVDKEKAAAELAELVRCKTVSHRDPALEDDAEFEKLIALLPSLYPNVNKVCEFTRLEDRGLLFRWAGKKSDSPAVMMAHYDVVPVNEDLWDTPAFEGIINDGFVIGRGTLDTKVTFSGILFAANQLIGEGFVPENDIYFAFSGGEEVNGLGAVRIVDYFEEKGIEPALVIDEGGAVVENVFPGVKVPCGLIGIAEKGMMDVKYTVKSQGGHASAPKPGAPIDRLASACRNMVEHPFKLKLTAPAAETVGVFLRADE